MSEKEPKSLQYANNPMLAGNAKGMAKELHTSMTDFMLESIYENMKETCNDATDLDLAIHLDVAIMAARCVNKLMCSLQVALLKHVQDEGGFENQEKIKKVIRLAVEAGDELSKEVNPEVISEFKRQLDENADKRKSKTPDPIDIKFTMKGGDA